MKENRIQNKLPFAIFFVLLIFVLTSHAIAETYYVKDGGNDVLDGKSDANAWATISKVTSTVTNGDTVYFRSQDTWTVNSGDYVLNAKAGITYDGGTYGSGTRATLTKGGGSNCTIQIIASNVTVKNFDVDGNDLPPNGIQVNALNSTTNISNITIDNCVVHNTGAIDSYRYGIVVGSTTGNRTTSDVTITNCVVYNTGHEGISLYPAWQSSGNLLSNVTVRGCEVYNTGTYNADYGAGILVKDDVQGATLEFNYLHDNTHGIQFETYSGIPVPTDITVRYNIIRGNKANGIYIMNNAADSITADIYGNLIIDNGIGRAYGVGVYLTAANYASSNFKFYNNTIFSITNTSTTRYGFWISGSASGSPTIEFKNNIVYTDDHIPVNDGKNWLIHNNNLIYRTSGSSNTHVYDGSINYDRAGVKTWEASAQNTDPTFKNTSDLPTRFGGTYGTSMQPNNDGLSIESGEALDYGADLGAYDGAVNLSGKADGRTRPQGSGWDIGAYEYVPDGEPPDPPTGLQIL